MWQAQQAWCTARGQQSSIISDLFEGQLQSSLTCSSCRATCHNFESFQDLSLPLPEEDGLTIQVQLMRIFLCPSDRSNLISSIGRLSRDPSSWVMTGPWKRTLP